MNDVIHEVVITTLSATGLPHVAPMGIRYQDGSVILMPFKPSTTHDNIVESGHAVLNVVVDMRVFAGCVTGRRDWAVVSADRIPCVRLHAALSHLELRLEERVDDAQRPRLRMARVHEAVHAPYVGCNRAQAAVLEAAVLVSRLHMLPDAKVDDEMAYLQIAIDKTAGPGEREAWGWLVDAVAGHRARRSMAASEANDASPGHGITHSVASHLGNTR